MYYQILGYIIIPLTLEIKIFKYKGTSKIWKLALKTFTFHNIWNNRIKIMPVTIFVCGKINVVVYTYIL